MAGFKHYPARRFNWRVKVDIAKPRLWRLAGTCHSAQALNFMPTSSPRTHMRSARRSFISPGIVTQESVRNEE